eukprot:66427-Amphidinium_carterae.1
MCGHGGSHLGWCGVALVCSGGQSHEKQATATSSWQQLATAGETEFGRAQTKVLNLQQGVEHIHDLD